MDDIASLGINIDTADIADAEKALTKLEKTSAKTELSTENLESAFKDSARATSALTAAFTKNAKVSSDLESTIGDLRKRTDYAEKSTDKLSKAYAKSEKRADGLADEVTRLSKELKTSEKRAKGLEKRVDALGQVEIKTKRATDSLVDTFKRWVGPAAAIAASLAALTKTVNVTREFAKLDAQLKTSTGSAEGAARAFDALQDFATKTPVQLAEVVGSFTKLVNLGLTPSERALTSYGDTASALGKSLDQFIEAVADASVAEFERLKEFGIKAKNQGDTIAFTFRGVTTEVKNSASEIEEFLISLGEQNFAGAMAEQMSTLDGAISNLQDQWNKLFLTISRDTPIGAAIESTVRVGIAALDELEQFVTRLAGTATAPLGELVAEYDTFLNKLEKGAPNPRALAAVKRGFREAKDALSAYSDEEIQFARNENLIAALDAELISLEKIERKRREAGSKFVERKRRRDTRVASINVEVAALKQQNAELEKQINLQKAEAGQVAPPEDRLAEFKIAPLKGDEGAAPETQAEKRARVSFERLQDSLRTEEEAIQDSYTRRRDIVLQNTEEGSAAQFDLIRRLNAQFQEEAIGPLATPTDHESQLAAINDFYARRRELILNNTAIEGEQRTAMELALTAERNKKIQQLDSQRNQIMLANTASTFGSLADLSKTFNGEQSKEYKVLFGISQAFSIAQTTMKTYEAAQSAYAALAPIPYVGPVLGAAAAGAAVAAGAANIASVKGQTFAGAYDNGGRIPSGSFGLVGEVGPELISGPANVTSRKETAKMFNEMGEGSAISQPQVNLKIINIIGDEGLAEAIESGSATETAIMNVIRRNQETVEQLAGVG